MTQSISLTTLSSIAGITFTQFKTDYNNGTNRASLYYTELSSQGTAISNSNISNYAELAKSVTANTGTNGKTANAYSAIVADENSVDLSVGSDDWLRVQFELMQADLAERTNEISLGNSGELNYENTNDIHEIAFDAVGLPPETYTLFTPTNGLGDVEPALAQALFEDVLVDVGLGDNMLMDGLGIDILNDWADTTSPEYWNWLKNIGQALYNDPTILPTAAGDELQDFFDVMGVSIEGISDWIDNLPGILNSNPHVRSLLPPWMQDVIGGFDDATNTSSPLVLDLDGDGIELAALNGTGSIYWDIDVDGMAEASGWITGGDGLLAIDLDADGVINDHAELFGNKTGSANGFVALAAYDTNSDDAITSADTQFDDLLVWVDANADGHSQADELHTLDDLSITSIDLDYSNVNYTISGNEILQESTFTINGQTRDIVDAWFAYDNVNTEYAEDYTLDIRTLFLPNLRGFGNLPDLHIAMSLDETLLDMVQEVAVADKETLLNTTFDLQGNIENILFRWAGVDGIAPNSRGNSISDARKLEFLEELLVEDFIGLEDIADPGSGQSQLLESAFATVLNHTTVAFFLQSDGKSLLPAEASYNSLAGAVEGVDIQGIVYFLRDYNANVTGTDEGDYYFYNSGNANDTIYDADGDDTLVFGDGIDTDDIRLWNANNGDLYIYHGVNYVRVNDHFDGTGEEIETALFLDGSEIDLVNNLTITGSSNSEYVYGLGDDNTLIGLTGNDTLYGGAGSDTYFHSLGDGNDNIYDDAGVADVIEFGAGITADDVRLWNANNGDLYLYLGSNYIKVNDHFDGTGEEIETALFADSTTLDLVNNLTFTGSSNSEYVYGLADDNTLIGLTGNDTLYGGTGNDTYLYNIGDGNDKIYDDAGVADVIEFGAGITADDVRLWNANNGDLYLYLGSNYIKVNDHFDGTGEEIETALFADSTTLDLVNNLTFTGTSYNEYVYGTGNADTLNGLAGNDRLYGYGDGDTLYGDAGNDYLYGGFGDDTLYGGDGGDYLYGEGGADNFVFESASAFNNSDIIQDFNAGDGDALDISDLLIEYDPLTDAITDFVHITSNGTNSFLRVDADGGANNFIQIAQLSNVTGLSDEEALETSGNLITA